jgi:WD40 repeat protein
MTEPKPSSEPNGTEETGTTDTPCDVFVSYAEADRAWVDGFLLDALAGAGVRYQSRATFRLGAPTLTEFERAVQQSRRTLLVLSPAYLAEDFTRFADLLAEQYGLETETWPVIPLMLEPVELPLRLRALERLDATTPEAWQAAVVRLCKELDTPVPGPASRPPCPYPGLLPFEERDADHFFGREADVQMLLQRLRLEHVLAVIGPSGSGKSSLVFAGLVPALRRSGMFGRGDWVVHGVRPGASPIVALAGQLSGQLTNLDQAVRQTLTSVANGSRLLLVVDQLEELFTYQVTRRQLSATGSTGQEAEKMPAPAELDQVTDFCEKLRRLSTDANCWVVVTVRSDFYEELMLSPLWSVVQAHRAEVLPLSPKDLREAIVRPAEAVGVYLAPALADRLVSDAGGEPGILPLVQETLALLWDKLERRFLPLAAYEALALARARGTPADAGSTSGLQVALVLRADAVLAELPRERQKLARRIFLRLVQFGEGRANTRRQQTMHQLRSAGDEPGSLEQTVRYLTEKRLLTRSGEEGAEARVDLAHEALIDAWPTLQSWIADRRDAEQTRRRLEASAAEWVRLGRGAGGLLDAVEVVEAERWLASADAVELGYAPEVRNLLDASRMALARQAARQRRQSLALGGLVISVLLAIISGLGYGLFSAQRDANNQTHFAATEQALAAAESTARATAEAGAQINAAHATALEAEAVLASNPELSILLGREALRQAPAEPRAAEAMRRALVSSAARLAVGEPGGPVRALAFSPVGDSLATGGAEGTAHIWDSHTGSKLADLGGHSGWIWALSYSPDGARLVTASADGTARLWEAPSGRLIAKLPADAQSVTAAIFSPDGLSLATAGKDGTIRVWDMAGRMLRELSGSPGAIQALSYSPDGTRLVVAGPDQTARIWDMSRAVKVAEFSDHASAVIGASFDPTGRQVVTVSGTLARVRDVETGRSTDLLHPGPVRSAVFSPDGASVLTASADGKAREWEVASGQLRVELSGHADDVPMAVFSPDGSAILTVSADKTARIWDARTGKATAELHGHEAGLLRGTFSPDGSLVATADESGQVRTWRIAADRNVFSPGRHAGAAYTAAFSPDGTCLATGGLDRTVRIWRLAEGCQSSVWKMGEGVTSLAFDRGGRVGVVFEDGSGSILDGRTGQPLVDLQGRSHSMYTIDFSPDGRRLVTAGGDAAAQVWDAQTGQQVGTLPVHADDRVTSAAFAGDGRSMATGEGDGTVRVWDADTFALRVELPSDQGVVHHVAFATDRPTLLVTGGDDGTARVWATDTRAEVARLAGHGSTAVRGVTFSSDGHLLLTVGDNGMAVTWQTSDWRHVADLVDPAHDALVAGAFSVDNRRVATAGQSGAVLVYPFELFAPIPDLLNLVPSRVTRRPAELDPGERATYVR